MFGSFHQEQFEASHPFEKSHLIGHLIFDNQSNEKLNGFDWILCESVWIWYENGWLNFEYIVFLKLWYLMRKKKVISPIWNENIWSMNCINIPYWAMSSFPIVENFSGTLSSGEEWWLGWGMVIIRILCWILFNC